MADVNEAVWWHRTVRLAVVTLSGFVAVACLPLLFATWLDRGTLFNLPFGRFLIALATPVVIALAIFWFAARQDVLDHRYDMVED